MTWMMFAAVPLMWSATPERPAPAAFDRHHGETLELRCTLVGFGEHPFAEGADVRLWYQTNGMGRAWWSVPATVASNTLAATFSPADDVGAERYALFFGAPSNAYASAMLRLRPSPGFTPNATPAPDASYIETDPTVPAWAKAAEPPAGGMDTNDVRGIVSSMAASELTEWRCDPTNVTLRWEANYGDSGGWYPFVGGSVWGTYKGDINSVKLVWNYGEWGGDGTLTAVRAGTNELNVVHFNELADFVGPIMDGATVAAAKKIVGEGGEYTYQGVVAINQLAAAAQSDADALALSKADKTTVDSLSGTVNALSGSINGVAGTVAAWETYWDGDEVRVTVTNYYGSQDIPALYMEQKISNGVYRTVWDERTRWHTNEIKMAALRAAIDEKADRAWGFYDSHTGEYAPDGYTWLSSPKIAIAAGLAYQRTVTSAGAVWVLASNGLVTETDGVASNGFFRITDDTGATHFEIVKGNKRTVGATATGIRVVGGPSGNTITVPYPVVSGDHPTLYGTTDLTGGVWDQLSATWLGQSGAWTAQVTVASSVYFVKAEYETGGETYIRNVAPMSVEGGIYCTDGVHKVRPVYNNGTITWELVQ